MFREKRCAERIDIRLPVSVLLLDEKSSTALAGPADGEAKNFSPVGMAITLANIKIDRYHIFFTCQDNPSHILSISIQLPGEPGEVLEVPAEPVWYDRDKESKGKRALIGVKFLLAPKHKVIKKLAKKLSHAEKEPLSWWDKIFK
jgi:hypothetical protein